MTTTNTAPRLYVGTYSKYNSGSLGGKWMDLEDYADAEEFLQACKELHSDEEDPELMFQDFEGFPKSLYDESMDEDEIQAIYNTVELLNKLDGLSPADWVNLHNAYCGSQNIDDEIYEFDEQFFDVFFGGKPMEAARATAFGKVNWSDAYIKFDGYANLQSLDERDIESEIDKDAIITDILENPENYSL